MSGGSNQQNPPMGGGMGGGQGGPQPIGEYKSNDTWAPPGFQGGGRWGGGMRQPGFVTGGPDDPAMGGSGYYGGGRGGWRDGYQHTPPGMGGGFPQLGIGGGMRGGFGNWAGLGEGFSEDQFMKARGFADRGKMGRARQAIQQGGGQWSPQLQGLLSSPNGRWGNMGWNTMY